MNIKNQEDLISKKIIKKITSGGFIFYRDNVTHNVYVLLIKNNKGEVWIPKGKLEEGESQLDAAFREIYEEVGIKHDELNYIDFCATDSYNYDLDENTILYKDLFINVFSVKTKINPDPHDWNDLVSADWYLYTDALSIIAFNKEELKKAYDILLKNHSS